MDCVRAASPIMNSLEHELCHPHPHKRQALGSVTTATHPGSCSL